MSDPSTSGGPEEVESRASERVGLRRVSLRSMDLGLFTISAALLTLEVLQTKIFSFSLDPTTVFLAIGVCLLGLGSSATCLALLPPVPEARVPFLASGAAALGALSVPPAHVVFARYSGDLFLGETMAIATLVMLTLPYFFFGLTIAVLLVARGAQVGRAYAVNMAGSGLGCLLVFPFIDHLGAETALVAISAMALCAAFLLSPPGRPALRMALVAAAGALLVTQAFAASLFAFTPDRVDQLSAVLSKAERLNKSRPGGVATQHLFSRWDRTGRIDVHRIDTRPPLRRARLGKPLEILFWTQDGGAGSYIFGVRDDVSQAAEFFERTVYGAGYVPGDVNDALIIGLGGGPDILAALHHGAKNVVGVDINATAIEIMRKDFGDLIGNAYDRPEVSLHRMDGRSFVRQSEDLFDLIQMSGVDTKSILATGSLSMNENYLYTREAMRDYLEHLRPDGRLVMSRLTNFGTHRLTATALAGLRDLGEERPEDHLVVFGQKNWRTLVVKRTAFTPTELQKFQEWLDAQSPEGPDVFIPFADWAGASFRAPIELLYSPAPRSHAGTDFFEALREDRLEAFMATLGYNVAPVDDDRPFFFFSHFPVSALVSPDGTLSRLYIIVGQLALISAVFILAPLVVFRSRGLRAVGAGRSLVYFTSLGIAFMFAEIGLIHRVVLLLGHQTYAITVVLFNILLGASLGSLFSTRLPLGQRRPWLLSMVALLSVLLVYAYGLGALFSAAAAASFPLRLALATVLLFLLGFLLGIPFPTGLRAVSRTSPLLVAWGIGVNGFASVLGSTMAIPVAMIFGLKTLAVLAVLLYALALLTLPATASGPDYATEP